MSTMEYIGGVIAFDPEGRKHTFDVRRGTGYSVILDGKVVLANATHSCAFAFIQKEAERRGWTRRATA